MQRFVMSVAAVALILVVVPTTKAGGKFSNAASVHVSHSKTFSGHPAHFHNYQLTHGVKFIHGYFYKGIVHRHWSNWYWNQRYGCYYYFDPSCRCYYYWCKTAGCYYPVSYITVAPPTVVVTPPTVAVAGSAETGTPPLPPEGE